MKMFIQAAAVIVGALAVADASAAVKVVTTTEDLASLTREVGGDKVEVTALAEGYQDPHRRRGRSRASSSSGQPRGSADRRRSRVGDRLAAGAA